MDFSKLNIVLQRKTFLMITEVELNELLLKSQRIVEKDTLISDKIRLLKHNNQLILQEKTTKDEYLIRIVKSVEEGEELIKQRMEIYDRMWDGCGCKVDYYN
jgi:hypothetical protein